MKPLVSKKSSLFTSSQRKSFTLVIYESFCYTVEDLGPGDIIFINDGTVKLEVTDRDVDQNDLICEVKTAGKISDNKGCNMPSGQLSVNVVTEKDAADLGKPFSC